MDLSGLSNEDLKAIASGDMSKVSTDGLKMIAGQGQPAPHPAATLGQALYDAIHHAVRAASPFQAGPVIDTTSAAAPELGKGLVRVPPAPDAGFGGEAMNAAGRMLPVTVGSLAASAALPAVAPAALAAAPLLAPAAATGIGAAAGNTAQQIGAKLAGGEAPADLGEAAKETAKVGLTAALTDLGIGATARAIAATAPRIVSMFKSFPAEGLKRTLQRPDEVLSIIDGAKNPQAAAESAGIKSLREIQNGLTMARQQAGKEVENALNQFQTATQGKPIIDGFEISDAGAQAVANRSTSEGVSSISDSEISQINKVIEDLNKQGPMSAKDAVVWRRKLDNMIDFKRGAVPEITSGEGQGVISQMASALRQQIGKAAEDAGFTPLAEANQNFSKIAQAYDAYRPAFNTKTALGGEAVRRLEAVERLFNKGGITQQDLTQIGQAIPVLQKPVDNLLDSVVARRLTMHSAGSPSGMAMTAVRFLAGPDGLALAANAARRTPIGATRKIAGALAAGASSK